MYQNTPDNAYPDRITLKISDDAIQDLQTRLGKTRWPDEIGNEQWEYGTNSAFLKSLCQYWERDFDFTAMLEWLNSFDHFKTMVDDLGIHYVHQKSSAIDAIPLLILHGWPSTYIQMLEMLPKLTNPDSGQAFHVVVASLPGYGLSDAAAEPGMALERIAGIMTALMKKLGYERFGARGSDLGGTVIDQIARHYPQSLIGAHLTGIIVAGGAPAPPDASESEQAFLDASGQMAMMEIAYARLHMSKPQTLAYGLNDSPAGLASWIVEKYHSWGDTSGDVESRFDRQYLLTTFSTYWFTESINSSIRLYYEMVRNRGNMDRIEVPCGFLQTHQDLFPCAPREWAERSHNVVHWSETHKGGHFLEWEEPELVARDLQKFFESIK